jgi:hypothetical protein
MIVRAVFAFSMPLAFFVLAESSLANEKNAMPVDGSVSVNAISPLQSSDKDGTAEDDSESPQKDAAVSGKDVPTSKFEKELRLKPTVSDEEPEWAKLTEGQIRENVIIVKTELAHKDNVQKMIREAVARAANGHIREKRGNKVADHVSFSPTYTEKNFVGRRHIRCLTNKELDDIPAIAADNDLQYVYGYAELVTDDKFDQKVQQQWLQRKRTSRLIQLALFGFGGLAFLAVAFAFFSTDHATRGFYTVRLQFVTVTVAAIVAVAIFLFARNMLWL